MAATGATLAAPAQRSMLSIYRDDGPLAQAIGARLGAVVRLPAPLLVLAGAVPLLAAAAIGGGDVSRPLAGALLGWFVLAAAASGGRPETGRLGWAAPGLVRVTEYVTILWLAAIASPSALPAAFALLSALAFRHYDLVYRLRHRGVTPPAWVNAVALGWDGRLVAAWVLLAAGALPAGFYVAAVLLAAAFVGDSVAGWLRFADEQRAGAAGAYEDEEDEGQ
jgi:hypothetical protein